MVDSSQEELLSDAFHAFISQIDATLTPAAFLRWVRKNRPALLAASRPGAVLAFAREYLGTPLRTHSGCPPLVPKAGTRKLEVKGDDA